MDGKRPGRKIIRLQEYDYSTSGAYFVTICTKDRKNLFAPVGADSISARMIKRTFSDTISRYPMVECPVFTVMPNHFHAIIEITRADMGSAPTLSDVVQAFKRYSTVVYTGMVKDGILPPYDRQIWQRSFYDHVIRNQQDYEEIYNYILANPERWKEDSLYTETISK